jgi:hypothetical protein
VIAVKKRPEKDPEVARMQLDQGDQGALLPRIVVTVDMVHLHAEIAMTGAKMTAPTVETQGRKTDVQTTEIDIMKEIGTWIASQKEIRKAQDVMTGPQETIIRADADLLQVIKIDAMERVQRAKVTQEGKTAKDEILMYILFVI